MNIKIKVLPKYAYLISSAIAFIFFCFFAYKAFVAYLIHKDLYGDGMDVLVSLRAALAGIMFLLIVIFVDFNIFNFPFFHFPIFPFSNFIS